MSVRIVEDYWDNVSYHKELIEKCFHHLYAKYPNSEGVDDTFNTLLTELYRLSVFRKFDPDQHSSDVLEKKFEQFLYVWIQKVLRDAFNKCRLRYIRYRSAENHQIEEISLKSYEEYKNFKGISRWVEGESENKKKEEKPVKPTKDGRKRRAKKCAPSIAHNKYEYLSKLYSQDEECGVRMIIEKIRESLTEVEAKMLDMTLDGVKKESIVSTLGCCPGSYLTFRKHLKESYKKIASKEYYEKVA